MEEAILSDSVELSQTALAEGFGVVIISKED